MCDLNDYIKERAYYLWKDDYVKGVILEPYGYYMLAKNVDHILRHYYFFKDVQFKSNDDNCEYDECCVCMNHFAKMECVICKQRTCSKCMMKLDKCPFCRNPKKLLNKFSGT